MTLEVKWQNFAKDKRKFFGLDNSANEKQLLKNNALEIEMVSFLEEKKKPSGVHSFIEAENLANDDAHGFEFTADNEHLIREEFETLFHSLKSEYPYREEFWFYCYYCCTLLQNYHRAMGQDIKAKEFMKKRMAIQSHVEQGTPLSESPNFFVTHLGELISDAIADLLKTPFSAARIRDKITMANLPRIYWFFCRTTITQSFLLARDLKAIDKIGRILHKNIDVDGIIHILEKPKPIFNALSVGFFAARFLINAAMVLKHTINPSQEEKDGKYKYWENRLCREIYKRHTTFLNDLVWGTVNLLTNYHKVFHISAPAANWMLAGFLCFDIGLLLWSRHLAEKEYRVKREQLAKDLAYYANLLNERDKEAEELQLIAQQCLLLNEQIRQLDINWQAQNSTFWFTISAATLLMAGFTASMLVSSPFLVIACYGLCTFAVAMYMSDSAFRQFQEKRLTFKQAQLDDKALEQAEREYTAARNNFIFTLVKNTVIPAILITTFAICWQAALVLTAAYLTFEVINAYCKYAASKSPEPLEVKGAKELEFTGEVIHAAV